MDSEPSRQVDEDAANLSHGEALGVSPSPHMNCTQSQ
jgi:hypothetical protein